MPKVNDTCRYVDFKCNLSGEYVKFPGINSIIKIGEKLGCGAYGDIFRGYLISDDDNFSIKRRNTINDRNKSNLQTFVDPKSVCSQPNLHNTETVTINSDNTANICMDMGCDFMSGNIFDDISNQNKKTDYAIKYFKDDSLQMLEEGFTSGTIRELSIMKSCSGHPNIIKLIDIFVGEHKEICTRLNEQLEEMFKNNKDCKISGKEFRFYPFRESQIFVLGLYEYCKGGDLGRVICKRLSKAAEKFTISEVKWYSFQLLNGLAFLHNSKIEHRDLKPNNIMLDSTGPYPVLKVGDWGLGREYRSLHGTVTPTACTMFYRPIEVILGSMSISSSDLNDGSTFLYNYGINVDIWSAACIIAEMITGQPLFHGNSDFQVLTRIVTIFGRPTEEEWKNCSSSEYYPFNGSLYQIHVSDKKENLRMALKGNIDDIGLDLLLKMLQYNPHKRISALEALSHPWFDDIDFRKLDSLGVVNCLTDSMKGILGPKIVDILEQRSKGILTTTLLSHLLFKDSSMKDKIISAIDRDYTIINKQFKASGLPITIRDNAIIKQ